MTDIGTLRTARLVATKVSREDLGFCLAMDRDERVMAFIGGPRPPEQTRRNLDDSLAQWSRLGFGVYVLRDAGTGAPVGRAGLYRRELDGVMETDLGYTFLPEAWGKGYATEIGAAVLRAGFEGARLATIVAFTAADNAASRRVMEKLGMRYEKDFEYVGKRRVLYRAAAGF
jgi:RimJ/RimL family protein N-acetyltransferase